MQKFIHLCGVRHHNLKNLDLDIPIGKLTLITGVSGSGKSTLAFDVLYAEGQRRYVETFSPYARQFFDRMDKPQADRIENILPSIAIEQRNAVRTSRSTVGTMTEICDYMKVIWAHIAQPYCPQCGKRIEAISAHNVWQRIQDSAPELKKCLIAFPVQLSEKLSFKETVDFILSIGYRRVIIKGGVIPLESYIPTSRPRELMVVQDRVGINSKVQKRFIDSCEQAYKNGHGHLVIYDESDLRKFYRFTNQCICSDCGISLPKPSPGLFSYNHPLGACPTCHGFGRTIGIDMNLVIPDPSKTLREGAIRPWQTGVSVESQNDLIRMASKENIPLDTPFEKMTDEQRRWVIEGDPKYENDPQRGWPHAWYGIRGYFQWLEERTYKMHVRVFLSRYRSYKTCTDCGGTRFIRDSLCFRITNPLHSEKSSSLLSLSQFYDLELRDALAIIIALRKNKKLNRPIQFALDKVQNRLSYLNEIGLGYLTLNRQTRQLSGGETERVNLTSCLGNRLVNTLYILDEPSVGLHPRDTARLIEIIKKLRDLGNTVVVVEHESLMIQAADHIIDLGPHAGSQGGQIIYQGVYKKFLQSHSRTAAYISNKIRVSIPPSTHSTTAEFIKIKKASSNNIHDLDVKIPLQCVVCITGVSGSGKSTLLKNIIYPGIQHVLETKQSSFSFQTNGDTFASVDQIIFPAKLIQNIFLTDQSPIGKTPRSSPAMYVEAFDDLRKFFIWQLEQCGGKKLAPGYFTYNSKTGQCPRCKGLGFEEIEMQFLSNIYTRCPECKGTRFNSEAQSATIEVRTKSESNETSTMNISDFLAQTVDEAISLLSLYPQCRSAIKAIQKLQIIQQTGLGYISLGQPLNTLSGGECQQLKLAAHIAESITNTSTDEKSKPHFCFLFDEPSTGLHFDDIQVLLKLFRKLVQAGHSVLLIEHNLDMIRCADWIIDLGPDAGSDGGQIIAQGKPVDIAHCSQSQTGKYLLKTCI